MKFSRIVPPLRRQAAFTLIELLVVVAIIGLLASGVIAALTGMRTRANNTRNKHQDAIMDKLPDLFGTMTRVTSYTRQMSFRCRNGRLFHLHTMGRMNVYM